MSIKKNVHRKLEYIKNVFCKHEKLKDTLPIVRIYLTILCRQVFKFMFSVTFSNCISCTKASKFIFLTIASPYVHMNSSKTFGSINHVRPPLTSVRREINKE